MKIVLLLVAIVLLFMLAIFWHKTLWVPPGGETFLNICVCKDTKCLVMIQAWGSSASGSLLWNQLFISSLSHAPHSPRCSVWFFVGLGFFEAGHFLRQLAARLLEWCSHQQWAVGRWGDQEHLQAVLPPNALYHETTAQVIILLSALPLISRISTGKTGHARKIKGCDD